MHSLNCAPNWVRFGFYAIFILIKRLITKNNRYTNPHFYITKSPPDQCENAYQPLHIFTDQVKIVLPICIFDPGNSRHLHWEQPGIGPSKFTSGRNYRPICICSLIWAAALQWLKIRLTTSASELQALVSCRTLQQWNTWTAEYVLERINTGSKTASGEK